MNGYELMAELDDRSAGKWKPSSGSIYPALHRLEQRGLIAASAAAEGDKPRYELTNEGRQRLGEITAEADGTPPWEEEVTHHGEIRGALAELVGPARQLGRFGSPDQIEAATAAIKATTASLYRILADGPETGTGSGPETGSGSGTLPEPVAEPGTGAISDPDTEPESG